MAYNLLGFRDPLEIPRYRVVKHIDVNLLKISGNSAAYDGQALDAEDDLISYVDSFDYHD